MSNDKSIPQTKLGSDGAYLAVKGCNMAFDEAGMEIKLQLQELEETRLEAPENSKIYKEKVSRFHD